MTVVTFRRSALGVLRSGSAGFLPQEVLRLRHLGELLADFAIGVLARLLERLQQLGDEEQRAEERGVHQQAVA